MRPRRDDEAFGVREASLPESKELFRAGQPPMNQGRTRTPLKSKLRSPPWTMTPPRLGFPGSEVHQLMVSQAVAAAALPDFASTVLTSNKGFEEWGSTLGDEIMAAALINRLLHHCYIVNIRCNSYRMREHQNLLRTRPESRRDEIPG